MDVAGFPTKMGGWEGTIGWEGVNRERKKVTKEFLSVWFWKQDVEEPAEWPLKRDVVEPVELFTRGVI